MLTCPGIQRCYIVARSSCSDASITTSVIARLLSTTQRRQSPLRTSGIRLYVTPSLSASRILTTYQNHTMSSEPSPERVTTVQPPAPATEAATPESETASRQSKEPELLPLSDHEFRQYNRLAERMDLFHNHFRSTWNMLWGACTSGRRPGGMSLRAFVGAGLQFVQQLELHHNIEETYFFPVLAKKMPEFRSGRGNGAAELLRQHKEIHQGLEVLQEYLLKCKSGETELEMGTLKSKMEGWGTVLWTHLDQEIKTLGAENMRKYWTVDEIRKMPM